MPVGPGLFQNVHFAFSSRACRWVRGRFFLQTHVEQTSTALVTATTLMDFEKLRELDAQRLERLHALRMLERARKSRVRGGAVKRARVPKLPGSRVTGNHTPQAQIAQPTMQGATLVRTVPQAPLLPTLGQMLKPPRPQLCTALGQKQGAEKSVAFPGATAVGC